MSKHALKEKVQSRFDLLDGDFRTFIWVRSEGKHLLRERGLGGGNLLVLMGELSLLSFVVKLNSILAKGTNAFREGSDKEINELAAFKRFIRSTDYPIGFNKDDEALVDRVWQGTRNTLFHMATLAENRASITYLFDDSIPFDAAIDLHQALQAPFEVSEANQVICNVDRLRRSLFSLWLPEVMRRIDDASEDRVQQALAWILRIESDPQILPDTPDPDSGVTTSTSEQPDSGVVSAGF